MKRVVGVNGVYVPLQMELVERGAFDLQKRTVVLIVM
jgi:hypothetical protein